MAHHTWFNDTAELFGNFGLSPSLTETLGVTPTRGLDITVDSCNSSKFQELTRKLGESTCRATVERYLRKCRKESTRP